jgi:hypothetical protein
MRSAAIAPYTSYLEEHIMKITMIAVLIGLAASSSAFAQTMPGSSNPNQGASSSTQLSAASTLDQSGQWVAPYGQAVASKTRAQVDQELVQSEQDGQLSYLDKTLYAHH